MPYVDEMSIVRADVGVEHVQDVGLCDRTALPVGVIGVEASTLEEATAKVAALLHHQLGVSGVRFALAQTELDGVHMGTVELEGEL